jgi:hypothetical protein
MLAYNLIEFIETKTIKSMTYNFTKANLQFTDYKWNAKDEGDDPKVTGSPDNDLLDRNEGYEVLAFIKRYVEKRKWVDADNKPLVSPSIGTGQKVERLIRQCPSNKRSHKNIEEWVAENW